MPASLTPYELYDTKHLLALRSVREKVPSLVPSAEDIEKVLSQHGISLEPARSITTPPTRSIS